MSQTIQAIRGMNDILPDEAELWERFDEAVRGWLSAYGYRPIRMPMVEPTPLFARAIGEMTDIVEKEMYSFVDALNGEALTLRPEGTASCVRAVLQHSLLHGGPQRLWYAGPMFRHERPQKGRYRQFHQFGIEAFGYAGPDIDAEQIVMCARLWDELALTGIRLEINSLGSTDERQRHRAELIAYLERHREILDADAQRRLYSNPLRVLDSKNPHMQALIEGAPKLMDFLGEASLEHFGGVQALLKEAGIPYRINPRLVRGLDYYNLTVFEWITDKLGAQGTVCAGGRYDGLIEQLGGKAAPACGFAMGVERLIALLKEEHGDEAGQAARTAPDIYVVHQGEMAQRPAFRAAEALRGAGYDVLFHCGGGNFKSQMRRADASGAQLAVIIGDDEAREDSASLKPLREDVPQKRVPLDQLADEIGNYLFGEDNDGSV
ncbi:MAG: histidine--tRNA ligase [Burkholderiales bacterium]|jgi:histidyl-tRNA synthetase|uniref:Histidine--tRNA ligase n=1 Tax=Candidatus Desulfobacillus denitrificans TaxID=2608985 RepID=A0A809R7R4_9PROT|nr:histidine--tRNA ligase [Rhodocyclaceae bacterium]MCZ2175672.1 histidine--tRNA ligase [Burkholderiales bacterium]OQY74886.1 MAG: histidine--tRNA ligase [Rhodocyclaceae bacterium UTPRO2]BBO20385.1 histidine--tRNA ligase [Candidatus Desulfobacillus denitrificans]GIK44543.1 MAG: histidine--tRNA ligase [Betaproteobacteria bacterium]